MTESAPAPVRPCEPCGGVGIANGRVCWACDGTGDPDGYDRLACSTQRVGDREWYCDTHKRNAEICQEAVDR